MFVYLWKDPAGTPFYVGMGSTLARTNPKGFSSRNRFCRAAVLRIGVDNIIVEIHVTPSEEAAKEKERALIEHFGTIRSGKGPLTNLSRGGEFHPTEVQTKQTLRTQWAPRSSAKRCE